MVNSNSHIGNHHENMPMEGIEFTEAVKIEKKKKICRKNLYFNIFAVLTRTQNLCFAVKIRKNMYTHVYPSFNI